MSSANDSNNATPTHVVTCFLLRHDNGEDKLFLVRRSQRVRTYRGAWAAVSGYLEPGVAPLEQAYTEIREETGVHADELRLLRQGEPVAFSDEAIGQSWVVHPFLFELAPSTALKTDWEATEHTWIAPGTLSQYETVPKLAEALAAVYPARNGR